MPHAVLSVDGADCFSCRYAIEHNGKKIDGVRAVEMQADTHEIHMDYEDNDAAPREMIDIVKHLGYNASVEHITKEGKADTNG
jgi:cation transport ATPase